MGLSRVAVVASAQTELRPAWHSAQHIDLISAVVTSVFKGTGLTLDDVDFVIDSGSDVLDGRSISNCGFLGALGAHHKEEARVEEDGLFAAMYGVNKIASGASRVGLIVAYSKPSESSIDAYWSAMVEPFYQRPVGFSQKAALGIQAQRYLAGGGRSLNDLADVVARRWQAAATFGNVDTGDIPDLDTVLAAADSASPLNELMMTRLVDGAVAVLVARDDIAQRATASPVTVTGMGTSLDRHAFASREGGKLASAEAAAKMAYRKAGWGGGEADVAEVSSASVVAEAMALDALGLDEGATAVNCSGGTLPADTVIANGLHRLAHAARQLSVPKSYGLDAPSRAVVHGAGGIAMQSNCVFTLEV